MRYLRAIARAIAAALPAGAFMYGWGVRWDAWKGEGDE